MNPSLHDLLKARFIFVRKALDDVMAKLSDDLLDWAPVPGMRTIEGQLFEIAGKEVELLTFIRGGGEVEWEEVETFGEREKSIEGWRQIFAEIRSDTLSYLDSLSEGDLNKLVPFAEPWWEGLYLEAAPVHELLRNIASHEWYHTGQIVSYLWSIGIDPED